MALDVLQSILDAEKSAEEVLAAADQSAAELVKAAENAARERERDASARSRELYKKLLADAREGAEAELETQSASRRDAIDEQIKGAAVRLPQAAREIIQEVLHGNR